MTPVVRIPRRGHVGSARGPKNRWFLAAMRQVLFRISPEIIAILALLLILSVAAGIGWMFVGQRKQDGVSRKEVGNSQPARGSRALAALLGLCVLVILIYFVVSGEIFQLARARLPDGLPIYGFGLMLFLAFVLTTWVAGRRAEKAGVSKDRLQDLAIWAFVGGLLGARIVYMIQYNRPIEEFFKIWEGGIVFYGSLAGGALGFTLAYFLIFRKLHVPWLRLADIIAPSLALGLALGRIG